MKFVQALCETVTRALGLSAFSPWDKDTAQQPVGPIEGIHDIRPHKPEAIRGGTHGTPVVHTHLGQPTHNLHSLFPPKQQAEDPYKDDPFRAQTDRHGVSGGLRGQSLQAQELPGQWHREPEPDESHLPPGPVFAPPNGNPKFVCDYSAMRGWRHAAGSSNRNGWIEKPIMDTDSTGGVYNIFTNFDQYAPTGIVRQYHLNVTDQNINCDGMNRPDGGKVFNGQYPGPEIEACWGDWLEITVENHLKYNGTAVHWHGVRMLNAFEYDGVNAISQCAIAPGDSFTYKFRVTQYGTSWYHSHYSLQYADGLAGPITFHGPHSADFDSQIEPYLFGDWSHNSAFEDYHFELHKPPAQMTSIILNGRGDYLCPPENTNPDCQSADNVDAPPRYEEVLERGRKYLMRLINTSTASTFIFSIDKHMLQVVQADFVAVEPYYTDHILVGIGQRYNVIVQAMPANDLIPSEEQNYWIRISPAAGCDDIDPFGKDERLGIIRYNPGATALPTTTKYRFNPVCADEPYESLVPVVPMTVTAREHPANSLDPDTGDNFETGLLVPTAKKPTPHGNFTRWFITNDLPMWLNLSDPLIDHLGDPTWDNPEYSLVTENYEEDEWVYIIMTAVGNTNQLQRDDQHFIPVAHPMHLHGHDFILLAQEERAFHKDDLTNGTFHYDNPPRRDVILMPRAGYVAIAFKPDNPGQWILHCHIAWHASSGLALNIRENEAKVKLSDEFIAEKDRVCTNWRAWEADNNNWWDAHEFQEDSGI